MGDSRKSTINFVDLIYLLIINIGVLFHLVYILKQNLV